MRLVTEEVAKEEMSNVVENAVMTEEAAVVVETEEVAAEAEIEEVVAEVEEEVKEISGSQLMVAGY